MGHVVGDDGHDTGGDRDDVVVTSVDKLGKDCGWETVKGHDNACLNYQTTEFYGTIYYYGAITFK